MEKKILNDFYKAVVKCEPESPWSPELKIYSDSKLSVYYAPFEHINTKAKVVICGITPGKTQATQALDTAKTGIISETDLVKIQEEAKQAASFKGFRKPLSDMLDLVGLNEKLNIETCNDLFDSKTDLVHYTSTIRYPVVLENGNNYNGVPKASKHPFLREMLDSYLAEEVEVLGPDCLWIPLGKAATEGLEYLVKKGALKPNQLLSGLPHPSGANAERVAYFLGNKAKSKLSIKVNPDILDSAKISLKNKIRVA
ncbi:hypothetical protein [Psychromonas sp. SA13A]|uniref:hypothetical protein n=1 Tax=Psychromonas sp. SA13A TaxID=2686346 RepID=UPI00140DA024|nr:hypothetical protein [Psychromonas sp. SA13A]